LSPLVTLLHSMAVKEVINGVHCLHLGYFDVAEASMKQAEIWADAAAYAAELEGRVQTLERARL
jgi:hypothetical protein